MKLSLNGLRPGLCAPDRSARHSQNILAKENGCVLVISHDDRYYHVADRVIKLDEGQLICDTRGLLASFEMELHLKNASA